MKKLRLLAILLLSVVIMASCSDASSLGGNDTDGTKKPSATQETTPASDETSGGGTITSLTVEALRNYPTSPESDFEWEVAGEGVRLDNYVGKSAIIVLPDTVEGKPVTAIDGGIFNSTEWLVGIVIPNTVKALPEHAFFGCDNLQIIIAEGVEELGYDCITQCHALKTLILSENLRVIKQQALFGCWELESLYVPPTVTEIVEPYKGSAFARCKKLTICGEAGSYIEQYCKDAGIPFKVK